MPALAITISSWPDSLTALVTIEVIQTGWLASPGNAMHFPLTSCWIWLAAFSANTGSRSLRMTVAPSFANCLQISKPIPWPAPVTIAVLLLNRMCQVFNVAGHTTKIMNYPELKVSIVLCRSWIDLFSDEDAHTYVFNPDSPLYGALLLV